MLVWHVAALASVGLVSDEWCMFLSGDDFVVEALVVNQATIVEGLPYKRIVCTV